MFFNISDRGFLKGGFVFAPPPLHLLTYSTWKYLLEVAGDVVFRDNMLLELQDPLEQLPTSQVLQDLQDRESIELES